MLFPALLGLSNPFFRESRGLKRKASKGLARATHAQLPPAISPGDKGETRSCDSLCSRRGRQRQAEAGRAGWGQGTETEAVQQTEREAEQGSVRPLLLDGEWNEGNRNVCRRLSREEHSIWATYLLPTSPCTALSQAAHPKTPPPLRPSCLSGTERAES